MITEYDSAKDEYWQKLKKSNLELPKFEVHCINCGRIIIGTAGELINKVPLCGDCRKKRKKVKR